MGNNFLPGAGEHFGTVFHDSIERSLFKGIFSLSGKAQQLIGEVGSVHDRVLDALDVFIIGIFRIRLQPHQRNISLDAH